MQATNLETQKADKEYSVMMSVVCGFMLSMGAIHMDTINWILPTIAKDLSTGNSTLMVTSGFFYGMMFGHILVGPITDMIGKKKTMLLGFIICILGAVVGANAAGLNGLIAARIIQGVGGAATSNAARAAGGDAGKGRASAKALAFMQIFSGAIPIILPMSGKWVGNAFGWSAIFWLQAAICGVLCLMMLAFVTETSTTMGQGALKRMAADFKSCMLTPEYLMFALCFALNMALFFCYAGSASFAMVTELGMDNNAYANMYAINAATMVPAAAIARHLAKKAKPQNTIRILNVMQCIAAIFISVLFLTGNADYHFLQFVWWVFPFMQGITLPTALALGLNASGNITGSGAAFMGFVQYIFASITMTMLASIKGTGSIGGVIGFIMAVCAVLSIVTVTVGIGLLKKSNPDAVA
jgi:DHA1 family bicyclomycin/chloramphenicol resistance-like MFS transporter